MARKLVVNNKDNFEIPQYDFFERMEIIESKYLPDNCFLVLDGDTFMHTTMYIFKYVNGKLCYHKIPPMWNIRQPIVQNPYEEKK